MATITAKLIKDGNSTAVRLPKTMLAMSGLTDTVEIEAKQGKIILHGTKQPRSGWAKQIAKVLRGNPKATKPDPELDEWDITLDDGI
ncbi:MAG: hypothetical protein V4702_03910 [Patescibacteria group bacterium]